MEDTANPFLLLNPKERVDGTEEKGTIDFSSLPECSLPPLNMEKQLQAIMDCILPPSMYHEDEIFWRQRTSTSPVTRMDMAILEEKFDNELKARAAKPFGVCPIRRQLYDQLFGLCLLL